MIEIERKYIIDNNVANNLIKKAKKKIGIVQWYLVNKKDEIERVRLKLENKGLIEKWNYAYKANTEIPHEKIEKEKKYVPDSIDELFEKEMIVKMRYIIKENPEIVLDEFIELEGLTYNIQEKYLLEIEMKDIKKYTKDDFDKILKDEGIELISDATEDYRYYNNNIANKINRKISLNEIIEVLKWRML